MDTVRDICVEFVNDEGKWFVKEPKNSDVRFEARVSEGSNTLVTILMRCIDHGSKFSVMSFWRRATANELERILALPEVWFQDADPYIDQMAMIEFIIPKIDFEKTTLRH